MRRRPTRWPAGPVVELENGGDAPTYVAGTENFYAITRYNWSSLLRHGGD